MTRMQRGCKRACKDFFWMEKVCEGQKFQNLLQTKWRMFGKIIVVHYESVSLGRKNVYTNVYG